MISSHGDRDAPKAFGDVEHGGGSDGAVHSRSSGGGNAAPAPPAPPPPPPPESEPAPMRNLYTAALSYNGFTITDGALRLIVLLHAADLGFNAIEIAFMFSMYEVAGVFTNLFGGVAGSRYGLRCTLLTSLVLQIACLAALTQTEPILGNLAEAESGSTRYLEATIYITAWQALAGVAKDLMKLTGKATPKLVTKDGAEGRLFQLVAWLTGMKNALKGFGHFLGALLVARIGYVNSLWVLVGICAVFLPVGTFGMDRRLGISVAKKMEWGRLFRKGRDVNVLSAARFFLFGSRDVWFEIGLPLFLRVELGWERELVGLILAGYIVLYGNMQAASTKLYKNRDGTSGRPTSASAYKWAACCSLAPLLTGIATYFTHTVAEENLATAFVLVLGLTAFAAMFAVNSSVHSYLIVSYSNKDKVAMDLGFYYMANAMGRLVGTLLGGFLYFYTSDDFGLSICLLVACPFLVAAAAIAYRLPDPVTPPPPSLPPQLPAARSLEDEREEAKKSEEMEAAATNHDGSDSSSPSGLPPHDVAGNDKDEDEGDWPIHQRSGAAAAAASVAPGARVVAKEDARNVSGPLVKGVSAVAGVVDADSEGAEAQKGALSDAFKSFEVVGEVTAGAQRKDDAPRDAGFTRFEGVAVAAATAGAAPGGASSHFDYLDGFPAVEAELRPRPPPPPLRQPQPKPGAAMISGFGAAGGAVTKTPEMPTE